MRTGDLPKMTQGNWQQSLTQLAVPKIWVVVDGHFLLVLEHISTLRKRENPEHH